MAYITKTKNGYRALVEIKGQRASKSFGKKRDAEAWATAKELEFRALAVGQGGSIRTLLDALRRYAEEVSPHKRGARWELIRLQAFESAAHRPLPIHTKLANITTAQLSDWRDARLKVVSRGTVLRDISLLSAVLDVAKRDWQWIKTNPLADMRKPQSPPHRDRVINWREIRAILSVLGYRFGPVRSVPQAVGACFVVALNTGMRAGELCGLTWDRVHLDYCRLLMTKNGQPRDVPLTSRAYKAIETLRGWDDERVFGLAASVLDMSFRRARFKAGLNGFTFHDSRHTAATLLAPRMDVLDLAKMFGWRNVNQAMVYYNPTATQIKSRIRPR